MLGLQKEAIVKRGGLKCNPQKTELNDVKAVVYKLYKLIKKIK